MYVDLLYLKLDRLYLGAEWGDTALIEILMLIILPCQFAIVFKTPPYWNLATEKAVDVSIELKRKSDGETSESVVFTYQPQEFGKFNNLIICVHYYFLGIAIVS